MTGVGLYVNTATFYAFIAHPIGRQMHCVLACLFVHA